MNTITNTAYEFLKNRLKFQNESNMTGGEHRAYSGKTTEIFVDAVINMFKEQYPNLNIEVRNDSDKIKIIGKDGVTFTEESVDRHIYINGKLELIIECKTYLDKCYLQRATDDCRLIRRGIDHPIQAWVVSLENGISDMAYNFFMFQDDEIYVDKCFFLSDGKRCSSRPIYRNYETRLNKDKIEILIDSFDKFFRNFN